MPYVSVGFATTAGDATAANSHAATELADVVPLSHTLAIVFPSLGEFVHERAVLRAVLADLQQHFAEMDLDLECCTLFESTRHWANFLDGSKIVKREVFIGETQKFSVLTAMAT